MGIGDAVMCTGEVRKLRATDPRKVRIVDGKGKPQWNEVFLGNPGIANEHEVGDFQRHLNAGGCRPYIDYSRTTRQRWVYTRGYRATPGELFGIAPDERGRGLVLIEPNIKNNASPNKQWGAHNWKALIATKAHRFGQMVPPGMRPIPGVEPIYTSGFREACGVMLTAKACVLPEGGLHHAAAALGLRNVVTLFGACTSPHVTGYTLHNNLFVDDPAGLGWRIRHAACDRAWKLITVERVLEAIESCTQG